MSQKTIGWLALVLGLLFSAWVATFLLASP